MSICDIYETTIGRVTLETRVYEDGYIQATLLDEFGTEIDSHEGNVEDEDTATTRQRIEDHLLAEHDYN